jgi:hypothetical protein
MTRFMRRIAAFTAMAALVFAQLAVSAYACPAQAGQPAIAASVPAAMDDCHEVATPNLCERHCDYGSSSVANCAPSMPAMHAGVFHVRIHLAESLPPSREYLDRQQLASHPPPPLVLHGVLRI